MTVALVFLGRSGLLSRVLPELVVGLDPTESVVCCGDCRFCANSVSGIQSSAMHKKTNRMPTL